MREFIKGIVVVFVLFVLPAGIAGSIETHYTRDAIVVEVTDVDTVFEDKGGNLWAIEDTNYEVGQSVKLSMFNGCTEDNIYDDEILKVTVK